MKNLYLITTWLFFSVSAYVAYSQPTVSVPKGQIIKKVKGMYGISSGKEWLIPAEYNSIEAADYLYIRAQKGDLIDLYTNDYKKTLVVKGLTLQQANIYSAFACCKTQVAFMNGKWILWPESNSGFTEQYDSIWPVNSTFFMPFIRAYQDGMIQVITSNGSKFGHLGTYKSFEMVNVEPPVKYAGMNYSFVVKAILQNGDIEYYESQHKELPWEIFDNDPNTTVHDWWQELKIFRNEKGLMGILDYNNKTRVPPILKAIRIFDAEFTAPGNHGFELTGIPYPPVITKDTFVLGETYHFITYDEMHLQIYPGGNTGGISMPFDKKFDYTLPFLYDVHCIACNNGVITERKTTIERTVVKEGYSYTIKSKVVWAELNEFGKFPTTSQTIVIPPEVEKRTITEENTYVCDQCFGYVDYTEGLQWNESLQEYQVFFMPHKMNK